MLSGRLHENLRITGNITGELAQSSLVRITNNTLNVTAAVRAPARTPEEVLACYHAAPPVPPAAPPALPLHQHQSLAASRTSVPPGAARPAVPAPSAAPAGPEPCQGAPRAQREQGVVEMQPDPDAPGAWIPAPPPPSEEVRHVMSTLQYPGCDVAAIRRRAEEVVANQHATEEFLEREHAADRLALAERERKMALA
jgi:hypothetical protein